MKWNIKSFRLPYMDGNEIYYVQFPGTKLKTIKKYS